MGKFCDVADFAAAHNAGGKQLQDSWSTLCAAADRRLSARHKRQRQHIVLQLRLCRHIALLWLGIAGWFDVGFHWTTATRDELYQHDEDVHVWENLHKHSTNAPERRMLARTALARTGQGRILQAAQEHRGELRAGHDRARRAGELHVC